VNLLLSILLSSRNDLPALAAIGSLVGVYLFYRGLCLLQRKRLILDTPASKIRSAAMGLVELSGLAVGPYTMHAPITGMPCYYYRTMAWQWQQRGKSSEWVKVAEESLHLPFFLDDNTGRVLVDPQDADLEIHRDFQEEFSSSLFSSTLETPANVIGFLGRHGVSTDQKIKIEEYCIKPKNSLFILGTLAENPGLAVTDVPVPSLPSHHSLPLSPMFAGGSSFRASIGGSSLSFSRFQSDTGSQQLMTVASEPAPATALDMTQQQRIVAALNKAGITSPAAWAAAGLGAAAAPTVAPATSPDATGFDAHPSVVLTKGQHNSAFLISWRSQRAVAQSLSWKSALMIWGGPALTLLCVYILALQYGWR